MSFSFSSLLHPGPGLYLAVPGPPWKDIEGFSMLKSAFIWEARSLSLMTRSHLCFNRCLLDEWLKSNGEG